MTTISDDRAEAVVRDVTRGDVWLAFHTADPGEVGGSEATATARILIARDAVQRIAVATGTISAGTFTLTTDVGTTVPIPFDADAVEVRHALEVIGWPLDSITVTGGPLPGSPVDVRFGGPVGQTALGVMTADSTGLAGGTLGVTALQEGVSGWSAPSDDADTGGRRISNVNALSVVATGGETVTHFGLWNAATGGDLILSAPLVVPVTTVSGQTVEIAAGNLIIVGAGHGQAS